MGLSLIVLSAVTRTLPLLVQQQIYNCQAFIASFSLELVTDQVGRWVVIGTSLLISMICIRIGMMYRRIHLLEQNIVPLTNQPALQRVIQQLELELNVSLIEDSQPFAFCFGLKTPHIYIATSLVQQVTSIELMAVLLHEKHHLEHNDSLTLFLGSLLQMVFPFIPLLSNLSLRYRLSSEILADQAAVAALGSRKPLVSALKKMLMVNRHDLLAGASLSDHALSARIHILLGQESPATSVPIKNIVVSGASVAFLLILIFIPATRLDLTLPVQAADICIGGKDCAILCSALPERRAPMSKEAEPMVGQQSMLSL